MITKTIKVWRRVDPTTFVIINESDYDKENHLLKLSSRKAKSGKTHSPDEPKNSS